MKELNNYSCIEFNGLLLNPSFSIYLFEITKDEKDRFFYVGMTGDNHYPSARSILHRLAGHISLLENSTQNQLIKGIKEQIYKNNYQTPLTVEELSCLNIKLHHWPIEGFSKWNGSLKDFKVDELEDDEMKMYDSYKDKQKSVLKLEKYLIKHIQQTLLEQSLNNPENNSLELKDEFIHILEKVNTIIKK